VTDYAGPDSGENRVNRGGSWLDAARTCRSAYRDGNPTDYRYVGLGFRLALAPVSK
jgi:formylglycine-generating enzyme required for sulfatase activity